MADRAPQAADFIVSCCPRIGQFFGTSDPCEYLKTTAMQMSVAKPTDVFPSRYIEHVAFAIETVASNEFMSPPSAVASVYLATRFEFYFRVLSKKLDGNGKWLSESDQRTAFKEIGDRRLKKDRISSVALAYKLMTIEPSKVSEHCITLDKILFSKTMPAKGRQSFSDLGERIEFGRNSVGHGCWGDISSESIFYGLLTAIIFHGYA